MRRILCILLFAACSVLVTKTAMSAPKAKDVPVRNTLATGPGCPAGSALVYVTSIYPDGPADFLEVIFSEFTVKKGPGLSPSEQRKHCNVAVDLVVPRGYRFALTQVHYEGYADIPAGSSGSLKTDYTFASLSGRIFTSKELPSPFRGSFEKDDTISPLRRTWSRCGGTVPVNMKSSLELAGPDSDPALMTVDLATHLLTQVWAIAWESC